MVNSFFIKLVSLLVMSDERLDVDKTMHRDNPTTMRYYKQHYKHIDSPEYEKFQLALELLLMELIFIQPH